MTSVFGVDTNCKGLALLGSLRTICFGCSLIHPQSPSFLVVASPVVVRIAKSFLGLKRPAPRDLVETIVRCDVVWASYTKS
jgi:hypothetical protein